ncbi:MAG: Solute-binding protein [Alphaproteobacteria bacterium MarineAlpha11_Bin1]|nr:MAG: Solute-binding protein [Alphaproteobacteria bacterium MarineAlpha11_Bin1]|tara:strand:+ start:24061 stop:25080 length:1020 start_codon:yes stop_codon:yes gene_type:complete
MKLGLQKLAISSVGIAAIIGLASSAQAQIDMKIGYPTTADPQHDYAVKFVAEVNKRTNGRVKGRVFPTSQLGKIPRQIEAIQLGTQEGFFAPPGFLQGVNKAFQVADVPGFFADHAHAYRALNVPRFKNPFNALGVDKGIISGSLWVYDGASYMATKPIAKLSDFKGMKIRVLATEIERLGVATLGATGVPIPFTSVVPSLQRKVVDGARTSLVVAAKAKFPTVTKHLTITNDYYIPCISAFSMKFLDKLSKGDRKIVMETADELGAWASARSQSFVGKMIDEWKNAGATVSYLSAEEQKLHMSRLAPLADQVFGKNKNPTIRKLYAILKEEAQRMDVR